MELVVKNKVYYLNKEEWESMRRFLKEREKLLPQLFQQIKKKNND